MPALELNAVPVERQDQREKQPLDPPVEPEHGPRSLGVDLVEREERSKVAIPIDAHAVWQGMMRVDVAPDPVASGEAEQERV